MREPTREEREESRNTTRQQQPRAAYLGEAPPVLHRRFQDTHIILGGHNPSSPCAPPIGPIAP